MRAFALFFGLMLAALASIAIFTYPAWLLLHPYFDFPFHRIGDRIGMLALAITFTLVARHVGMGDKRSVGYALPRPLFIREMLKALVLGVVGMMAIVGIMTALGLLDWSQASTATGGKLAKIVFNRLLSGLAVGLIEETMLRGVMFAAIERESGTKSAIILTSLVYADAHPTPHSGLDLLAGMLHRFSEPLVMADAYICLFAVGIVLAMIRARRGNIAACWGLHAGWVWVILITRELTKPVRDQPLSFLLSQFDGFIGWLVFGWTVLMGVFLVRFYAPQTSRA
jgi:membrane protease YdiL (CAAX protease family)